MPEHYDPGINEYEYADYCTFLEEVGADLAYDYDSRHLTGGDGWDKSSRRPLHDRIIESKIRELEALPKTPKPILIYTAGPGGAGKSTALQERVPYLLALDSEPARSMHEILGNPKNGTTIESFALINHDAMKEAIWREGGFEHMSGLQQDGDRFTFSPAELSGAVHVEASWLMERVAREAMNRGCNVAYEGTMRNLEMTKGLLDEFQEKGYERIAISVEEPRDTALLRNYQKWLNGRKEFERNGGRTFGATLTPQTVIRDTYPPGSETSICRTNVDELARIGCLTAVVKMDRGELSLVESEALGIRWDRERGRQSSSFPVPENPADRVQAANLSPVPSRGNVAGRESATERSPSPTTSRPSTSTNRPKGPGRR
ncbi:zeta toxin family protein [Streptomyces sp. NPDC048277]|uniref:zeta toxin family protein n=1 Tax=Streptomyces sp. NPDC048277 TaxID=3155027 RepID=UPI0033D5E8C6